MTNLSHGQLSASPRPLSFHAFVTGAHPQPAQFGMEYASRLGKPCLLGVPSAVKRTGVPADLFKKQNSCTSLNIEQYKFYRSGIHANRSDRQFTTVYTTTIL